MPSSPGYKRDYKAEYKDHHSSPKAKKERAARNKACADKGVKGKDVDHKVPLRAGGSTGKSNTRVRSIAANRSDNGHSKGETQKRKKK